MAAIHEGADGEARSSPTVPLVLNLAVTTELTGTRRGAGRRGTNSKKVVTWGAEGSGPSQATVQEEEAPS